MADRDTVVAYPTSAKQNEALRLSSPTRRLRKFASARRISGWLLVFGLLGYVAANFTLWTPENLSQVLQQIMVVASQSEYDTSTQIAFPMGNADDYALFDNGMAILDTGTLSVLQAGGLTMQSEQLTYTNGTVQANDRVVLVYNRAGYDFMLSNGLATTARVTLGSPIISADLGEMGGLTVVTDESGYKTAVTVFDEAGVQRFKWSTSEYYISEAVLSPSGDWMCVAAYQQQDFYLATYLFFFDLTSQEVQKQVQIDDAVVYGMQYYDNSTVMAVCDEATYMVGSNGVSSQIATYTASDLLYYDANDDYLLLAVRSWQANERANVSVYTASGSTVGIFALENEPQAIALAENRVAVLSANGVTMYNTSGTAVWLDAAAMGAKSIVTNDRGEVWAVFGKYAQFIGS